MTTLPTEILKQAEGLTFRDLHPAAMKAVAAGTLTIVDLLDTLEWFRGAASWKPWRAFLCALYALPMDAEEFAIYRRCTGRTKPPTAPARECWCPTGRRARKSAIAALIAIFEGGFRDYSKYTAPGERAVIPLIGKNMEEAKQIASYCRAILADEHLRHLLEEPPGEETIKLITEVDIRIRPASLTAGRGKTIPCAELDEVAFFATEGAAPDVEVVRGIRPGQATVPGAKLFAMSSPWAKRGLLYENTKDYHGAENEDRANEDRVLIWWAPTVLMHDTPQLRAEVAEAYRKDPISAEAEFGSIDSGAPSPAFREDVESFVLEAVIDACMEGQPVIRPPVETINYFAFTDPSGGSADSMSTAIAHYEPDTRKVVLDCILEKRAPFNTDVVVDEHAQVLAQYGLFKTKGDKYAGKWPKDRFREKGVTYELGDLSKSQLYGAFLPILNSGQAKLLDHAQLRTQLLDLDRRVARGGHESIDHSPGQHDDVANAVAGACLEALKLGPTMPTRKPVAPPPVSTTEIMQRRIQEMTRVREKGDGSDRTIGPGDFPYRRGR